MKKIAIITIRDNTNYGNRLQNYGMVKILESLNFDPYTIWNKNLKNNIKIGIKNIFSLVSKKYKRYYNFEKFTSKHFHLISEKKCKKINYFVVGSDQVWNYKLMDTVGMYGTYFEAPKNSTTISYAASLGVSELPKEYFPKYKKMVEGYKAISVREDAGEKIMEQVTGRNDISVLIDPTLLLDANEWDKISEKPRQLKNEKYILCYFLGDVLNETKEEIKRIAKEKDCKIINILDKDDEFYTCGPSEFLYLEKNAELICTDSFHSSVFAIIYNRPFVIFERNDKYLGNMSSRIDTLIDKFHLKNRRYNGKNITKENLEHDYTEAYKILEDERKKSMDFFKNSLDINESSNKIDKKN